MPKFLSGFGVEGFELLAHVPMENQSARRCQHRAVARRAADIKLQDLAGGEIDFGKAGEFIRIGTWPGSDVQLSSARCGSTDSQVTAVVDIRRVERVRYRAVRRGPVAARVPEANDVVIPGLLEDIVPVDCCFPGLYIDVGEDPQRIVRWKRFGPEKFAVVAVEHEDAAGFTDGGDDI